MPQENKTDRRILRTKHLLTHAFIELILEKGYDAVTIQDIIDRANVGRSTFYAHYENKEQLLFSGQQHVQEMLIGTDAKRTQGIDFLMLYQHAADNFPVAKAMLGKKGGDLLTSHIQDTVTLSVMKELEERVMDEAQKQGKVLQYIAEAASAALVRLLTCWLHDNMPFTPAEMARKSKGIYDSMVENI